MNCLNIGCGNRFHPEWTNIDIVSRGPTVRAHNIKYGLPFPDDSFEIVYHSHVIEHLEPDSALRFMQECRRVLTPGGIIRVVTPDLEMMVRLYLNALEKALQGDVEWKHNYEWIMLELYDQTVREFPGGKMLEYLRQDPIPNEEFVKERIGNVTVLSARKPRPETVREKNVPSILKNIISREKWTVQHIKLSIIRRILNHREKRSLEIGEFRSSGEVHKWMYDRYSLSRLFKQAGFEKPKQRTAIDSAIENWCRFNLDTDPDGTVYKPDSIFMEALKV